MKVVYVMFTNTKYIFNFNFRFSSRHENLYCGIGKIKMVLLYLSESSLCTIIRTTWRWTGSEYPRRSMLHFKLINMGTFYCVWHRDRCRCHSWNRRSRTQQSKNTTNNNVGNVIANISIYLLYSLKNIQCILR